MEITRTTVRKVENKNPRMKGIAYVELDGCFVIENIRIIEREDGTIYAAMPNRDLPNGEHKDICHPINKETRKMFDDAIIAEYKKICEEDNQE